MKRINKKRLVPTRHKMHSFLSSATASYAERWQQAKKTMELKPKIGVDNLKFGMTRKEVIGILNEPDRILTNEDDDNELILEWNSQKLRLTFYQNENDRFGYLRTINPELKFNGKKIIGAELEFVKKQIFANLISEWEIEDYDFFIVHFNEQNWLTLHVEYGIVTDLELGVPFENDEDYNWPK